MKYHLGSRGGLWEGRVVYIDEEYNMCREIITKTTVLDHQIHLLALSCVMEVAYMARKANVNCIDCQWNCSYGQYGFLSHNPQMPSN